MKEVTVKTRNKEEWREMQAYLQKRGYIRAGDMKDSFEKYPIIVIFVAPRKYMNVKLEQATETKTISYYQFLDLCF